MTTQAVVTRYMLDHVTHIAHDSWSLPDACRDALATVDMAYIVRKPAIPPSFRLCPTCKAQREAHEGAVDVDARPAGQPVVSTRKHAQETAAAQRAIAATAPDPDATPEPAVTAAAEAGFFPEADAPGLTA